MKDFESNQRIYPDEYNSIQEMENRANQENIEMDRINPSSQQRRIPLKSRQLKALTYKTLSSQRRALGTNLCCLCACPVLMVVFSGVLGALFVSLIQKNNPIKDILYCSNVDASNSTYGYPNLYNDELPTTSSAGYAGATLNTLYHANFLSIVTLGDSGPPGAAVIGFKQPCVYEFGESYPTFPSSLYQPAPTLPINPITNAQYSDNYIRDASFIAQIKAGWLPTIFTPNMNPNVTLFYTQRQIRYNYLYGYDTTVSGSALGTPPTPSSYSLADFAALPVGSPAFASASNGILGTIPVRYWLNFTSPVTSSTFDTVPRYSYVSGNVNAMDDSIATAIRTTIAAIAGVDKSILFKKDAPIIEVAAFFSSLNKYLQNLPYGYVYFTKIDPVNVAYKFLYSIGFDKRFSTSTSFPPMGIRQMYQQTQLDNSFLRTSNPSFASAQITQGFRAMPQLQNTKISYPFDGIIGGILYPFGISFLLPVFVVVLVREKEERIEIMMKMNGLKTWVYYFTHYATFLIQYLISSAAFIIAGYIMKLTFFTQTAIGVLLALFFLWGNVQISLAFFFGSIFKRSRIANISLILVVLCSVIISLAIDQLYPTDPVSYFFFLWPPFAFYRALLVINRSSYSKTLRPYVSSDLNPSTEVGVALLFLFFEIFVYLFISIYITLVAPKEFGVRRPWHFPITDLIKYFKQRNIRKVDNTLRNPENDVFITVDESELKSEDADVKEERARISAGNYDPNCPLIMKHMRKVYAGRGGLGPKLAVKDVTLAVEEGVIFGLLGPNGAGKTTLISILTGLYEATVGDATLAGFDIRKESNEVYQCIGVCPQFDILWEDLTVEEHLYFYTRLKGVPKDQEQEQVAVTKALEKVSLQNFRQRLSKGLSGGEKRRLSIAIALCGNPSVVFLDEPTTGLDPEVRRLIWNIINDARAGKTVILTTHSMEEAEALCQRIGIMAKGTLRCLANPIRLKEMYGNGFKLFFNSLEEYTSKASEFIESLLPNGWTKVDSFATNVSYEFPAVDGVISKLFQLIEDGKVEQGILDWGLGQTTLEEVFVRLISESDAQADY